MNRKLSITILAFTIIIGGYFYVSPKQVFDFSGDPSGEKTSEGIVSKVLAARFDYLSKNGNSSCSGGFKDSIANMPDDARLQGSCCSPMSIHRYSEQVQGLKKFKSIAGQNIIEIPEDPYNVEVKLAKHLMSYYDVELTLDEQKAYDYAMQNSSEKGPCCCKCWRWYVYGGLGKNLIRNYGFTGEQITELWSLSDGCGGDEEHKH